jgi:DNA-binding MarR family transcriptional regulator
MPRDSKTKRVKFVEIAEARTEAALQAIRRLGNLSNRRLYDFTEQDIEIIIKALNAAILDAQRKFGNAPNDTNRFKISP